MLTETYIDVETGETVTGEITLAAREVRVLKCTK